MKRLLILIAGTVFLLSSLTGCISMGDPDEEEDEEIELSAEEGNNKKAENTVRSFIECVQKQNYNGITKLIYLPENAFVTDEDIAYYIPRSDYGDLTGTDNKITDLVVGDSSGLDKKVAVKFKDKKNAYVFNLKLGDDDTWKVHLPGAYVENWSIRVPQGCTVTVDTKDVSAYAVPVNTKDYSLYTFPAIGQRPHTLVIVSSLYKGFTQDITPKTASETFTPVCKIKDAEVDNILKSVMKIWNSIYADYKAGADAMVIKDYFVTGFNNNILTDILTNQLPTLEGGRQANYRNFAMTEIRPWTTNNYGAGILESDNSVRVTFAYKLDFTDSDGNYHNVNKVTTIVMAYEDNTYKIKSLGDSKLFSDSNYKTNDF